MDEVSLDSVGAGLPREYLQQPAITWRSSPQDMGQPSSLRTGLSRDWGDVDGSDMTRRAVAGWESLADLQLADLQHVDAARPAVRPRFDQPQHRPPPCPPASSGPAGHIAPVHTPPISGQSLQRDLYVEMVNSAITSGSTLLQLAGQVAQDTARPLQERARLHG